MRKRSLIPNSSPFSRSTRFPFTYRFAARVPCDSKGSQCQCGIQNAEAGSALRSPKNERAAKEKPTPISQFFKPRRSGWPPNSPPRPGEAPPPRPLCQKICYSDCTENCPLCPLRAPRRFRNPKIGQQLGAQPTPRFRGMLDALLDALHDALLDAMFDPLPPFTFCCPQAIVDQDAGV